MYDDIKSPLTPISKHKRKERWDQEFEKFRKTIAEPKKEDLSFIPEDLAKVA